MPGTTANGFPYAEPTDPLVQWPATSQQLAQKSDTVFAARVIGGTEVGTTDEDGAVNILGCPASHMLVSAINGAGDPDHVPEPAIFKILYSNKRGVLVYRADGSPIINTTVRINWSAIPIPSP